MRLLVLTFLFPIVLTSALLCLSCRPMHSSDLETSDSALTAVKETKLRPQTRDLLAEAESFANNQDMRQHLGRMAWAMGYGYYWGCAPKTEGWLRSEAVKKDDQSTEINFVPTNAQDCPKDQPALRTTLRFRVAPISGIETYDVKQLSTRGSNVIKASMRCEGQADACTIQHIVSTGYSTQVTKTRDYSFGQNVGLGGGVKFSSTFFGVGGSLSIDVGFKLKFGTSIGTSIADGTNKSETAMYTCPLVGRKKSRKYLGAIVSAPVQIAAKHRMKIKLVPEVSFEGFPRASDSDGNHWLDHPTNRPNRVQTYGYGTTPFWSEMKYYAQTGYDKKDSNSDARLSWSNLNQNPSHREAARDALRYFERFDARTETLAESESITAIDDLICLWADVTDPDHPKPVLATVAAEKGKKKQDFDDLLAAGKLPAEVQKALTNLIKMAKNTND